jgi:hypothetical protein
VRNPGFITKIHNNAKFAFLLGRIGEIQLAPVPDEFPMNFCGDNWSFGQQVAAQSSGGGGFERRCKKLVLSSCLF